MFKMEMLKIILAAQIEPYLFLLSVGLSLAMVSTQQLFQDKICQNTYHESADFCDNLSHSATSDIKLDILEAVNTFEMKNSIITAIPAVIWCLLVGGVCDKYKHARKYFLLLSGLSMSLTSFLLLLNVINFQWHVNWLLVATGVPSLFGSYWVAMTICFAHVASSSDSKSRAIRFVIMESTLFASMAIGQVSGNYTLKSNPWFGTGTSRNYVGTCCLGLLFSLLSILWAYIRIKPEENQDNEVKENPTRVTNGAAINEGNLENSSDEQNSELDENLIQVAPQTLIQLIKEILNPRNIIDNFKIIIKPRPMGIRFQLLLLIAAHFFVVLEMIGVLKIKFTFVQRLYFWDFVQYNNINTISSVLGPLSVMIIVPIMNKVFKMNDASTGIVGSLSLISGTFWISVITSKNGSGYFIGMITGCLGGAATISIRSIMSKLVPKDEITRVFAALTTMEVTIPFIAGILYSNLFNATIKDYPTCIFQLSGFFLMVPLIAFVYIGIKQRYDEQEIVN